jgi:hypothetical protein
VILIAYNVLYGIAKIIGVTSFPFIQKEIILEAPLKSAARPSMTWPPSEDFNRTP